MAGMRCACVLCGLWWPTHLLPCLHSCPSPSQTPCLQVPQCKRFCRTHTRETTAVRAWHAGYRRLAPGAFSQPRTKDPQQKQTAGLGRTCSAQFNLGGATIVGDGATIGEPHQAAPHHPKAKKVGQLFAGPQQTTGRLSFFFAAGTQCKLETGSTCVQVLPSMLIFVL